MTNLKNRNPTGQDAPSGPSNSLELRVNGI